MGCAFWKSVSLFDGWIKSRLNRSAEPAHAFISPFSGVSSVRMAAPQGSVLAVLSDVGSWHKPDLQRPLELGPIIAALPTFDAECLVIAAFPTQRQMVPKVGT